MSKIFVLTTAFESYINNRRLTFTGKYLNDILSFNSFSPDEIHSIRKAVLYWSGKEKQDSNSLILLNCYAEINNYGLVITFTDYSESTWKSVYVRYALKKIFAGSVNIPLCLIADEDELISIINQISDQTELDILWKKNDWLGIYNKFAPYEGIEKKAELWNDTKTLSGIAFAAGKLSECPGGLNRLFSNDNEKKEFLTKIKNYRKLSLKLYRRIIELQPENHSSYSALAYMHYRFAMELSAPGGRRDGNFFEECNLAIENFDKALQLNPDRIKDLYRKGNLMTELMPDKILYSPANKQISFEDRLKESNTTVKLGIESLKKALESYQRITDPKSKKSFFKHYIKSLYNLCNAYTSLSYFETSDIRYLTEEILNYKYSYNTLPDLNLELAENYAAECIKEDSKIKTDDLLKMAEQHGIYDAVYKLYLYGKNQFYRYITTSDNIFLETAKKFLLKALETKWNENNRNQSKIFIAEKLARIYICEKKPELAIEVLHPYAKRKNIDYYAAYTLAEAYLLKRDYKRAYDTLNYSLRNRKSNKEMWKGHLLNAITLILDNKPNEAQVEIENSLREAKETGKKSIDYLLAVNAYIKYKLNDKENALKLMEKANEISGGKYSFKIEDWLNT
ncbi:MAG: hypothetical protein N2510_07200 [Ignavibacteria bacterium]|nr:hypothetical protein [Ignavibacteria bacterium]